MPKTPLYIAHLWSLILGVASFCVTFIAALFYLVEHRELKGKKFGRILDFLPPLEILDRLAVRTLILGFIFLTFGMISGVYLAHMYWSGDWIANPKVILSIVTWCWYLLLLLLRYQVGWRGGKFFALTSVGFVLLVLTFLGMMYLAPTGGA